MSRAAAFGLGRWSSPHEGVIPRLGTHGLVALTTWAAVWLSINTGPWVLWEWPPAGLLGWVHYIRALFPFAILTILPIVLSLRAGRWQLAGPLRMWTVYGVIALLASMVSLFPFDAMYWAVAYLCVIAAAWVFMQGTDPLRQAVYLNWLTWAVTSVFLLAMLILARESLFEAYRESGSFYGAYGRQTEVVGVAMSRSSGLARFAAVPGLVALVFLFRGSFWMRVAFGLVGLVSAWFIYNLQSRGAIFALAGSVLFLMVAGGTYLRFVGLSAVTLVAFAVFSGIVPQGTIDRVVEHITRGQDAEMFSTFTGRTKVWEVAWLFAQESLFYGHGMQADRFLFREHVHNTYFYALLSGGLAGLVFFLIGLAWAWVLLIRLSWNRLVDSMGERTHYLQASALLVFFTVRSATEVCGAMFAVDMMVMVPAILYLTVLDQQVRAMTRLKRREQAKRFERWRMRVRPAGV